MRNPEANSNREPEPEKVSNATNDDLETLFQQESIPDNERARRTPNTEQEDFNTWESEMASSGSSFADKIRNAADRVATILDNRAETKDTRAETRAEKIENAKDRVRKVGGQAVYAAQEIGIVSIGVSTIAVEAGANGYKIVRQKVIALAMKARVRFAERAAYKEKTERMDTMHEQALQENDLFDDHTQAIHDDDTYNKYDQATTENEVFDAYPEAEKDNEMFDAQTEAEAMDEQFDKDKRYEEETKAEEMDRDFNEARRQARIKAEVARRMKLRRKAARREKLGEMRNRGSEILTKLRKGRIGRTALKVLRGAKRVGSAVSAGVSGAKAAWQETA